MTITTVAGTYDPYLVALSYAVACFASYTALDLAGRVRASTGWARGGWLTTAAISMGGGRHGICHLGDALYRDGGGGVHGAFRSARGRRRDWSRPDQPGGRHRCNHLSDFVSCVAGRRTRPAVCAARDQPAARKRRAPSQALSRNSASSACAWVGRQDRADQRCLARAAGLCARGGARRRIDRFHDGGVGTPLP